jgi:hypothetical protein
VKTRLVIAAAAVTLPVVLAACQPEQTGAAALVGTNRLSERQVASETKATFAEIGPAASGSVDTGKVVTATVGRFVHHELVIRAAAAEGVTVSQGDVDALISQSDQSGGRTALEQEAATEAYVPPAELDEYARDVLLERKIVAKVDPSGTTDQQDAALLAIEQKAAKQVTISVSPRYGTFDLTTLQIVPGLNDLSSPLGSASAAASSSP